MTRLSDAQWVPTVHLRGYITPELVVVHESGTRIGKGDCVRYCKKNIRKVAYHVVIDRDGTKTQMAPLNRRVNHAGISAWKGREWCNNFSIGVALVGPTELTKNKKAFFGRVFDDAVPADSPYHGRGHWWLPYTPEQLTALHEVIDEIRKLYPSIEVTSHYVVSPGRKIDPSPLIDMTEFGAEKSADPPATIAAPEPADQVLASNSREYKATNATKTVMGVGAVGGVAAEVGKAAGVENITFVKSYLDIVSGFVSSYGVTMLVVGCVAGWGVMELIQHWKRESYDDGRYEPSGEANNEAGGDWA